MKIKKLLVFILSFMLTVPYIIHAEGEYGKVPSVNYGDVVKEFENRSKFGDPSGQFVYKRENVIGKKRDVYVFNLPGKSGIEVGKLIQNICYEHLKDNYKNSMRKDTSNIVMEVTGGAAASLATATAAIAAVDVPKELEIVRLPIVLGCGCCACFCSCLTCCAGCTSRGIESKSKDIKKMRKKLVKLIENGAFLNSNVLVIAFDKRDSCCCRKSVYIGFKRIDGLSETIGPIVKSRDYFHNVKFETEIVDMKNLD